MFREIGSNFWLLPENRIEREKFWWEKEKYSVEYFKSGRNAIKAIAQILGNINKTVMIPLYTCETVIAPFVDENWNVYYYDINEDMSINDSKLLQLVEEINPTILYVHSYFGFNTLEKSLKTLKAIQKKGVYIVEDITQSLFSNHYLEFADFYISSLRKYFAIPEGGVVISRNALPTMEIRDENKEITNIALEAFAIKEEYTKVMDENLKLEFRRLYGNLNNLINENDELQKMGSKSLQIFQKINREDIISKRIINYNYLYDLISNNYLITPIFKKLKDGEVPLYFPFYIKDISRIDIQKKFAESEIYCPIIWPKSKLINYETDQSEYMYSNMLCIPIDQRYNQEDMDRVVEVLNSM